MTALNDFLNIINNCKYPKDTIIYLWWKTDCFPLLSGKKQVHLLTILTQNISGSSCSDYWEKKKQHTVWKKVKLSKLPWYDCLHKNSKKDPEKNPLK